MHKRDRATKDTTTDVDELSVQQRAAQLEDLELRDISDRKLRKVLRDLDAQVANISSAQSGQQSGAGTSADDTSSELE